MSYQAIAGALSLVDVSAGERLVALSLASYANTDHRSYPGTRLAAARAGMSKRQFEEARDALAHRGLVVVESQGGGRGHKATVWLLFAATGPWCEQELNAPLMEAVLSHSRLKGSARVLLAVLAALADGDGVVDGLSTDELRAAAGMPDRTYRRARTALLASGEASVASAGGGRARLNAWLVQDPRISGSPPLRSTTERPTVPPTARPLMASARPLPDTATGAATTSEQGAEMVAAAGGKGPDLTGLPAVNGAELTGVSVVNGADLAGVSVVKGAELTGVSRKTPAETPAQTPAPSARAGRESLNPLTGPPRPPGGGSRQIEFIEEFTNDKGRRRKRAVIVDLDRVPVSLPLDEDRDRWRSLRSEFERIVGTSTFEIWLAALEMAGASEEGELLLAAPRATAAWIRKRFGRVFDRAGETAGCRARLATDQELQLLDALSRATSHTSTLTHHQEAV